MDTIKIDTQPNMQMDCIKLQKMALIYNAVQSGWRVEKKDEKYIFSKKHEGKKEVYLETYVRDFIEKNMDINTLIE